MSAANFPMPPQTSAAESMMSFIGPMLHGSCSAVNKSFWRLLQSEEVNTPLQRVIREITRQHPKQAGREATWLAAELGVKVQTVHNWHSRGIPAKNVASIAKALGWSMEQVSGDEPPRAQWPFEGVSFARFDALTERQKGVVEQAMLDAMDKVQQTRPNVESGKQPAKAA